MFKGIRPSKRTKSGDFTLVTSADLAGHEKENQGLTTTKSGVRKIVQQAVKEDGMDLAFNQLLDDLQIPTTLRPKLTGMDSTVKAAMLKSSQIPSFKPTPPIIPQRNTLRKARSSDSLESPRRPLPDSFHDFPSAPATASQHSSPVPWTHHASKTSLVLAGTAHVRGASFDVIKSTSKPSTRPTHMKERSFSKNTTSPAKVCSMLTGKSTTQLEVDVPKKLRLLLRNEAAEWTEEFVHCGGYNALLTRLNELLEVEWREEQHDDQILHELLRCFKALSTSEVGCLALRASCPTPFAQLVSLLYSDKKPGDVPTRLLIVELIEVLFDLYPPSSVPGTTSRPRQGSVSKNSSSPLVMLPALHRSVYTLVRSLLLTPAPPKAEDPAVPLTPHGFIEDLHRPRIYKTYLQELSDVCRDYFWIFCHPNNTIWHLGDVDEARVEKPRAPGGMTGGVEFEAMGYLTTHMKLLNSYARSAEDQQLEKEDELSAHRLHADLFASGFERILLVARKASTTYYPTLHLEISRYIAFVARAKFELPWAVSRLIGPPPSNCTKIGRSTRAQAATEILGSPSKKRPAPGAPVLPSPKRTEPIKI